MRMVRSMKGGGIHSVSEVRAQIDEMLNATDAETIATAMRHNMWPGPATGIADIVLLQALGVILDKLYDIEERLAAAEKHDIH